VTSGGHCLEGFVSNPEVRAILDISPMKRIEYDAERGAVAVEAGATVGETFRKLFETWGVVIPLGEHPDIGMGGHVAGGAFGFLCRQLGLAADYLYAVEVVTVDEGGRAASVVATRETSDPHRELWWAHTGGGGGNFGIVTTYYFAGLPSPPATVSLATTTWPWSGLTAAKFATLLANFGGFLQASSAPSSPYAGLSANIHAFHRSAGHVSMTTQAAGPAAGLLEDFLTQVSAGVPGASSKIVELPWLQAAQTLNTTGPNQRSKHKSAYLNVPFPDDQVQATYAALTSTGFSNPAAEVQIDSYGGQVNAVAADATAVAQRSSIMKLQYHASWAQPADDAANLAWLSDFYGSVYAATGGVPVPNGVTDGCYVNYPDTDLPGTWPSLYYKGNYPALQAVKARWDPLNVFNHAQSVTAG
jgi:FAD/FMN-containing dehydrogenase